jgi:hypothetical protein
VQALRPLYVQTSVLFAFAITFGGGQAHAGHVSIASLASHDSINSLVPAALPPISEQAASRAMTRISELDCPEPQSDHPIVPVLPSCPTQKPPHTACPCQTGNAANSSRLGSGDSHSTPPSGDVCHSFVLPPVFAGLLPPQTGGVSPFSGSCVPLRPPRAT